MRLAANLMLTQPEYNAENFVLGVDGPGKRSAFNNRMVFQNVGFSIGVLSFILLQALQGGPLRILFEFLVS